MKNPSKRILLISFLLSAIPSGVQAATKKELDRNLEQITIIDLDKLKEKAAEREKFATLYTCFAYEFAATWCKVYSRIDEIKLTNPKLAEEMLRKAKKACQQTRREKESLLRAARVVQDLPEETSHAYDSYDRYGRPKLETCQKST